MKSFVREIKKVLNKVNKSTQVVLSKVAEEIKEVKNAQKSK